MKTAILSMILVCALSGCAHVMKDQIAELHVVPMSYEKIRDNSDRHLGKVIVLGGVIVATSNSADGGLIEVVQYPLTDEGFPDESGRSAGRFLVTSPTPFDSATYPKGVVLTVIGEIKGERSITSQWETVRLPVLSLRTAHIWKSEEDKKQPFLVPGTNLVDPYYSGHDMPLPKRPYGIKTDTW